VCCLINNRYYAKVFSTIQITTLAFNGSIHHFANYYLFSYQDFVLSFDESIWQYIGRNWFRFRLVPYAGGVDNKSPLIFMIYGFSDFLFSVNYWFPRLLAIVCQSIGIYFVYRITKHVAGKQSGMLAVTLYGLSLLWKSTDGKIVSLTQTYEITFLITFYH